MCVGGGYGGGGRGSLSTSIIYNRINSPDISYSLHKKKTDLLLSSNKTCIYKTSGHPGFSHLGLLVTETFPPRFS